MYAYDIITGDFQLICHQGEWVE